MKPLDKRSASSSPSRAIAFAIALGSGISLLPRVGFADDPVHDLDWAHQQFNKGLRENNKRNYAEGRRILAEVWPKYKTYDVASELSRAEGQLGNTAASAKYAAYALAHVPPREGNEFKKIHMDRLAYTKPRIYAANLTVTPADVTVVVDDVELDVPLDIGLFLDPGAHRVDFKKTGFVTETKNIDAKANVQEILVVNLVKEAAFEPISTTPKSSPQKPPATLKRDPPMPIEEPPASPDTTLPWSIIVIGSGLTAIAVGTGVYYHVSGSKSQDDADRYTRALGQTGCTARPLSRTCQQLIGSLQDRADSYVNAKVLYGVGAGLAVVTGVLAWLTWPSTPDSAARPKATAWATHDAAGVAVFGSF